MEISANRSPTWRDILGAWIVCALIAGSGLALAGGLRPAAVSPAARSAECPAGSRRACPASADPSVSLAVRPAAAIGRVCG